MTAQGLLNVLCTATVLGWVGWLGWRHVAVPDRERWARRTGLNLKDFEHDEQER